MIGLLPPDFLVRYDEERLNHIGRYLRALVVRAERGAVHLKKALERGKEIRDLDVWRETTLRELPAYASEEKHRALANFGWINRGVQGVALRPGTQDRHPHLAQADRSPHGRDPEDSVRSIRCLTGRMLFGLRKEN